MLTVFMIISINIGIEAPTPKMRESRFCESSRLIFTIAEEDCDRRDTKQNIAVKVKKSADIQVYMDAPFIFLLLYLP